MNLFKPTILGILLSFITFTLYSQAPQSFSYQAVIRDESGSLVQEEVISVQISIKQGSVDGAIIYAERHAALTNQNGLITLKIGEGSASTGDFQEIDWSNSPFYIETSVDLDGGTNYNIVTTSELLSVPFALYADKAQRSEKADYSDRALIADSVLNLPNNLVRQENQQLELRGDTLFLSDSNFTILSGLNFLNENKMPFTSEVFDLQDIIDIVQISNSSYIMMGFPSLNESIKDIGVLNLDSRGNRKWFKTFGGSADDIGRSIIQTSDRGFILTGSTSSNDGDITDGNKGGKDIWVLKLDSNGNKQWDKTFGGSADDIGRSVMQTSDGGFILIGETSSNDRDITDGNNGGKDIWVLKLDSNGIKEWDKTFGGSADETSYNALIAMDQGIIILSSTDSDDGDISSPDIGEKKTWIIKLDSEGNKEWDKTFKSYFSPKIFISDNITLCGILSGRKNVDLITIDNNGLIINEKQFNTFRNSYAETNSVYNDEPNIWNSLLINENKLVLLLEYEDVYAGEVLSIISIDDNSGNTVWFGSLPRYIDHYFYWYEIYEDSYKNLLILGSGYKAYGEVVSYSKVIRLYPKGLGYQMN